MASLYRRYSRSNAFTMAKLAGVAYRSHAGSRVKNALSKGYGLTLATLFASGKTDTQGFIAHSRRAIVIAFRGTESAKDAMIDLDIGQTRRSFGRSRCKVHKGFGRAFHSVRTVIRRQVKKLVARRARPIFIVGHSLGGALATLCALDLATAVKQTDLHVYTFGSPRVGDKAFAKLYGKAVPNTYRVRNNRDIVTTVPLFGYQHVGSRRLYDNKGKPRKKPPFGVSLSEHKLASYYKVLG